MSLWYDFGPILSRNCLMNFVIGDRGGGKSYGAKKLVIKDFLRTGSEFIYLRRYKEEINPKQDKELSPMLTFPNDLIENNEFPGVEFEIKSSCLYINKKKAGYFMALNNQSFKKSVSLPKVKTIIFDEFLIDDRGKTKYLKDEVNSMLSLIDTILRLRDNGVRVIFLGNALSFNNPYFYYFNIKPFLSGMWCDNERSIAVELWHNDELKDEKRKTRFGRLILGTKYDSMAVNNDFYLDNDNFVEHFSVEGCEYSCTVRYNDTDIGVWYDRNNDYYLISYNVQPTHPYKYALTDEDHTINYMMCGRAKGSVLKYVKEYHSWSRVRYFDRKLKALMYEVFTLI